jgi:DNA-binding transcriptional ArsR family regulator/uncharacterized protein YndB with AHSA1/START domain
LKSPRRASSKLWRALSSPVRRRILDRLRDGPRTTGELTASFPRLSRFAVMQHLRVLTGARLVLVRREGRYRFNYLNAVPLVQAYERWVSTYAGPMAHGALALKRFVERPAAEGDDAVPTQQPLHEPRLAKIESEIRIDAPPARVFEALTTRLDEWWQFRVREQSTIVVEPRVGGHVFEDWGEGRGVLYGTIAQYDPPHSFCSAGVNGWKSATFITWHRLEPASDGRATILRKSMQFFGDVDDEFVSRMEQGNRAIMEKLLKDYCERGIGRGPSDAARD